MRISDWSSDVCSSYLNRAVVTAQRVVRFVNNRGKAIRFSNGRFQIVRNDDAWHAAKVREHAHMRAYPVLRTLGPRRLAVGIVGTTQHADKDLRRSEERRVGNGCVSTGRSGGAPYL